MRKLEGKKLGLMSHMPWFQKLTNKRGAKTKVEDEVEAEAKVKAEADLKFEGDHESGKSMLIPTLGSRATAIIVIVMAIERGTAKNFYRNSHIRVRVRERKMVRPWLTCDRI